MVDSIAILPPGLRVTDNNGNLITDGVLSFFTAGTTTPITVYSDKELSVSLGTSVSCNSAGYPVTSGNAKTLIYTGPAAYKIRLSSAIFGGTCWEHDNVRGALDTSSFLTTAAVADKVIVNTSTNRAVTIADKGKLLNCNCTAGALTITLDPASTLTSGFWTGVRHDGTANSVKITGNAGDTFGIPGVNTTTFSLTGRGQTVWISCDGTSFKIDGEVPPLIMGTTGVIRIADRLSTPPVGPNPGDRYIVTAAPGGAWSTFAEHDIAEANGSGGWFRYTPAAGCGWMAYVVDEQEPYLFRGSAWAANGQVSSVNGLWIGNNSSTPTTQLDVFCDSAFIGTHTGEVSVTINGATTGANGLDTGSLANNTWYHIYLISNGQTAAGLISTSATSPTMPAGYTHRYRVGAQRTGGSATFLRVIQVGNQAQYTVVAGSTTPSLPIMNAGSVGSPTTPTWSTTPTGGFIPPTAVRIQVSLSINGTGAAIAAPSAGHGGVNNNVGNPPPLGWSVDAAASTTKMHGFADFVLQSSDIFYASNQGSAWLLCNGWTDAVNAN